MGRHKTEYRDIFVKVVWSVKWRKPNKRSDAKNLGVNLIERYIKPDELKNFDEVFLTGTAAEITPVKSIDALNFNTGDNTTTFKFMKDYKKIVTATN